MQSSCIKGDLYSSSIGRLPGVRTSWGSRLTLHTRIQNLVTTTELRTSHQSVKVHYDVTFQMIYLLVQPRLHMYVTFWEK